MYFILNGREAYLYILKKELISYPKNISAVKKGEPKKCEVLSDLKMWYHCEAKKKSYTTPYIELQHTQSTHLNNCTLAANLISKDTISLANT